MNAQMKLFFWKMKNLPFISIALVVVNTLVFLLCVIFGNSIYNAGCTGVWDVIVNKEYGRILWAMFLHSDIEHLFSNMMLIFFLGSMLEQEIGHLPYGVVYFLSGIGGNIVSLYVKWMSNDWSVSIGASGAAFGLDGLLLAAVLLGGGRLQSITPARVLVMIGLSLYSGFAGSNIDNAAHVGGLLVGFCLGVLVCLINRRKQR